MNRFEFKSFVGTNFGVKDFGSLNSKVFFFQAKLFYSKTNSVQIIVFQALFIDTSLVLNGHLFGKSGAHGTQRFLFAGSLSAGQVVDHWQISTLYVCQRLVEFFFCSQ